MSRKGILSFLLRFASATASELLLQSIVFVARNVCNLITFVVRIKV